MSKIADHKWERSIKHVWQADRLSLVNAFCFSDRRLITCQSGWSRLVFYGLEMYLMFMRFVFMLYTHTLFLAIINVTLWYIAWINLCWDHFVSKSEQILYQVHISGVIAICTCRWNTVRPVIYGTSNSRTEMFLVSSCSCHCPIHWSQVLGWDWSCTHITKFILSQHEVHLGPVCPRWSQWWPTKMLLI